jgi:hypothetical protein
MLYHRVRMEGTYKHWRTTSVRDGRAGWIPWRPGYFLPGRWKTTLDGDDVPYLLELDFLADEQGPDCHAMRFVTRDGGEPISARRLRAVPVAECIQLAIGAAAVRTEQKKSGELVLELGGGGPDASEQFRKARPPDQRTSDEHLREVAAVYRSNNEKPTQAVQDAWPISYSTAARWVMQARQRGFLPPTKRRGGGTPADVESLGTPPRDIPTTALPLADFLGTDVQARARAERAERAERAQRRAEPPGNPNEEN